MFRAFALFLSLLAPALLQAQTTVSDRIAAEGLAPVETSLAALPDPSPSDRFALGGVRFLRAIERALQTRYRYGMTGETMDFPVLRLHVGQNPAPEPFDPAVVEHIFAALIDDMTRARTALQDIAATDQVAVRIDLGDLWFDVNANGTRETDETLVALAGATLFPRLARSGDITPPTIQFDTADAAWLRAYTHFLDAIGQLVLAFPPTDAIARTLASADEMRALVGDAPPVNAYDYMFATEADAAMMIYLALRQQPDPARTRAAHRHLLQMIRENRIFWDLVARETDNDAEWIPNPRQTSALGITLPPETAQVWQAVLTDAEDLLEGRKLIPHWRYGSAAGINLKRLMQDPVPVEPAEWLQGMGLLPYAERGERVGVFNWRQFTRMVRGDSMMFVLLLN